MRGYSGITVTGRRWRIPGTGKVKVKEPAIALPDAAPPVERLPIVDNETLALRAWAREWIARQESIGERARRHNVTFDSESVTVAILVGLWQEQQGCCALSGKAMSLPVNGKGRPLQTQPCSTVVSVDRIDSRVGYRAGNIQLVCYTVNRMKSNMPETDFRAWCLLIANTY